MTTHVPQYRFTDFALRRPAGRPFAPLSVLAAALALLPVLSSSASAQEGLASPWADGHNVRTRLIAGHGKLEDGDAGLIAGVEIDMADGWKTYWRNPGEAGGVPPSFDWSGSTNLASATVLYPAPRRFVDRAGTTIGYKTDTVFPVRIVPKDQREPVTLKLAFAFGTCKEICVPGESTHELTVPPGNARPLPEALAASLRHVPSRSPSPNDPVLRKTEVTLTGTAPRVLLHAEFPAGREGADALAIGPDGEYVPTPVAKGESGASGLLFEIDLTMGADIPALTGKPVTVTLVSDHGQSEAVVLLKPPAH